MANSKSALKRIRVNERNRIENNRYRSSIKTWTKKYYQAIEAWNLSQTSEAKSVIITLLNETYSKIDKASKKNILPKNTAARKKSNLAKALKLNNVN